MAQNVSGVFWGMSDPITSTCHKMKEVYMRTAASFLIIAFLFTTAGCYHATVETGLTPSAEVIHESFASSWIYGLVSPSTIAAQLKCKHGVAKVETQLSFVNQLVGFITFGIYTPMEIKVTCAASSSMGELNQPDIILDENASTSAVQSAFLRATDLAVSTGKPVYVMY
jgi:hypothetical protein